MYYFDLDIVGKFLFEKKNWNDLSKVGIIWVLDIDLYRIMIILGVDINLEICRLIFFWWNDKI